MKPDNSSRRIGNFDVSVCEDGLWRPAAAGLGLRTLLGLWRFRNESFLIF
jgi:hypothetical protein